jgi:hypothetical protein
VGDLSRSSYSNIEQQSLDYVQNGLMPWLRRIESAIARDLLENDDEYFAEFDTRGSLRADAAGRATYYNTLWQLGVASVNEIRSWENMNPVEGGDVRFVQLNMTTLEKAAAEPEVPATVVEEIVVDETAPAPEPADAPTVIEVIDQYRSGSLTLEGAKALLMVSFPQTPEAMIDAILAGVVMKEPEPVAEEPAPEPVAEPEAPAASSMRASRDCGTGSGGFKPGNKCAGEGGGESDSGGGGGSSRYREAKTREEAEQVAKSYAKNVSFRGVDVASANKINKSLDEFFEAHPDVPPLESLESKKFTGGSSTGKETAAANYNMLSHKMMVNTAIMGSEKKWEAYQQLGKEAEQVVSKALSEGRLTGRQKEIAEMHLSRGTLVDGSFSGAITHEMGHHFDAKVLMKQDIAVRKRLMDRRPDFEPKLSGYASTNAFEYFAESYVAYRRGRDIDPELKAVFESQRARK